MVVLGGGDLMTTQAGITAEEAKRRLDAGEKVIFLDARSDDERPRQYIDKRRAQITRPRRRLHEREDGHRKNQMLDAIGEIAAACLLASGGRKPSERRREDHLQQQTEPENGKGDAADRDRRRDPIERPRAMHRGDDARWKRDKKRNDERRANELERRGQPLRDAFGHRTAVAEAVAPVAADEGDQP